MDEWLTITDAAEWLKVCKRTVRSIISDMEGHGSGGIWREGRVVRINKRAMEKHLRKGKT